MVRRLLPSHRDYVAWTNHPLRMLYSRSDRGAIAIVVRNAVIALSHCALDSPFWCQYIGSYLWVSCGGYLFLRPNALISSAVFIAIN